MWISHLYQSSITFLLILYFPGKTRLSSNFTHTISHFKPFVHPIPDNIFISSFLLKKSLAIETYPPPPRMSFHEAQTLPSAPTAPSWCPLCPPVLAVNPQPPLPARWHTPWGQGPSYRSYCVLPGRLLSKYLSNCIYNESSSDLKITLSPTPQFPRLHVCSSPKTQHVQSPFCLPVCLCLDIVPLTTCPELKTLFF